ncbi:hypothetical protein Moror_742 [Moniliophthora roreri MCA 2997]|uniref:Mid2 domain-containing protein n=2 Tax=Moniliophthora roreri TaxID=221103 RepID=V2XAW8_MONRO|nr:hypothetical protein Moror_742 [Moniliophthora roreri MCA 2997]KAI3614557.1 hypothetical protein WG66_009661 [Moniliophthora roreri]
MNFLLLCLLLRLIVYSRSFTFTWAPQQVSECDDVNVSWTGGTPPFRLIIVTPESINFNFTIPIDSISQNTRSFTIQVPVPKGNKIILSMSDQNGPLSGGTSDILTVGENRSGRTCNTARPNNDFFFTNEFDPVQCQPFSFTEFEAANGSAITPPLTIFGYVPGGDQSVLLHPTNGVADWDWIVTLKAGTQVVFTVTDAMDRLGGTDLLRTVGTSNDASCLSPGSLTPSSTSLNAVSTNSVSVSATATSNATVLSTGAIAGIAVGGAVLVGIIVSLILLKRRRESGVISRYNKYPIWPDMNENVAQSYSMYSGGQSSPFSYEQSHAQAPNIVPYPSRKPPSAVRHMDSQSLTGAGHTTPSTPPFPNVSQPQIIFHRDMDDNTQPVHLPPEYADRQWR